MTATEDMNADKEKSNTGLIIGFMFIGIAILAGGGYYLYVTKIKTE